MKLKRFVHRLAEELYTICLVSKKTSICNFVTIVRAKYLNYRINKTGSKESNSEIAILKEKHQVYLDYFQSEFDVFCKNYKSEPLADEATNHNCIWVCWWQGIGNAPELVRNCVESIMRNAKTHRVVIIEEKNYSDYIDIPGWLLEKVNKGIISVTHLSDYIRVSLLARYGGIWLDSTFFCWNLDFDDIYSLPVWTIKRPDYGHLSVACGQFSNYSLACDYNNRIVFQVIKDYLEEYWKRYSFMVDYLFLDYLIQLSINNNEIVRNGFKSIPSNNPCCDDLQKVMSKSFNQEKWKDLTNETSIFKLSWKRKYDEKTNGGLTFYGMIVNNKL